MTWRLWSDKLYGNRVHVHDFLISVLRAVAGFNAVFCVEPTCTTTDGSFLADIVNPRNLNERSSKLNTVVQFVQMTQSYKDPVLPEGFIL